MTFWSSHSEPQNSKMKYRFMVNGGGDSHPLEWHALKSIDKPSFEINVGEYQLGNHIFKYPGVAAWNDIELVFVDVRGIAETWYQKFQQMGHGSPEEEHLGLHKNKDKGSRIPGESVGEIYVQQYRGDGALEETWIIKGAFIKSVNFGSLAYEEDGFVEVTVNISYDYAQFSSVPFNPGAHKAA